MRPRILIAHALLWPNAARLCRAFSDVGFDVAAIAQARHPAHRMRAPTRTFAYSALAPRESLETAIREFEPEIVVPCDDRALQDLRSLVDASSSKIFEIITRSLGGAATVALAHRSSIAALADVKGVRIPRTDIVRSASDLRQWSNQFGLPAILKLDGTWGGRGVAFAPDASSLEKTFRGLRRRSSLIRSLGRLIGTRDLGHFLDIFIRREVIVQSFVEGRAANIAVACWNGDVIAAISCEVLRSVGPFGMARVVRVVGGEAMLTAARSVARRHSLSGLHGLDFVVGKDDGEHWLVEINARATQTGHLPLGPGRDLPAALYAAVTGSSLQPRAAIANAEIAIFPQELRRDGSSQFAIDGFHDLPHEEPEVLKFFGWS